MCRFVAYLGTEIHLRQLVTDPTNSIIHQSFHSHERAEPLNGDGFGLAWYPDEPDEPPALFKSTTPAWSNRNLREIARVTRTRCLLAHVRAATPGLPVTELNCHPFREGRLTFMHNGSLGGFPALRRQLLARLSDEAFASIEGSTDSEHIFAVLLDRVRALADERDPTERLARAMQATVAEVEALRRRVAPRAPSLLNLLVCDGERVVVTRHTSGEEPANSLYYACGRAYVCEQGLFRMADEGRAHSAVIVASEPLDESGRWERVEAGRMVVIAPDLEVTTRPLAPEG